MSSAHIASTSLVRRVRELAANTTGDELEALLERVTNAATKAAPALAEQIVDLTAEAALMAGRGLSGELPPALANEARDSILSRVRIVVGRAEQMGAREAAAAWAGVLGAATEIATGAIKLSVSIGAEAAAAALKGAIERAGR